MNKNYEKYVNITKITQFKKLTEALNTPMFLSKTREFIIIISLRNCETIS